MSACRVRVFLVGDKRMHRQKSAGDFSEKSGSIDTYIYIYINRTVEGAYNAFVFSGGICTERG